MPSTRKRKGAPSLEETAEPSKRRFAEGDEAEAPTDETSQPSSTTTSQPEKTSPQPTSKTSQAADDRAARFAALRARATSSKKQNLNATKSEAAHAAIDPTQLTSLHRKKDIATHKLLKADVEASGGDFERQRAWDWTIEESEKWDERLAEKARKRDGNKFASYGAEAGSVYERQVRQNLEGAKGLGEEGRLSAYEQNKIDAIERAVASGGLELVETPEGELIAVDRDGSFLSTADSATAGYAEKRPSKQAVDRLVEDIKKAEEVRQKKRKERGRADENDAGDVTYINEKNKQFNMKLARFYNKYTADIRESFERGTAI
ncbi:pre-mRNA-splicing factor syf2 like protein [Zymoseptoria brevis]|uniref:Pre-mRNA-splicing factor SYF2 n=1 Tax=Zymoseptoria brevis TaxID=1047168 RepID=A0A0F4G5B9_9PEZI|nr:pre-mRNA-splicing factor syf2 like protein [Zymoseptoria brevis]